MIVSRGLVGPKLHRNSSVATGKQVNIPVLMRAKTDAWGQRWQDRRLVQTNTLAEKRHVEKQANM